MKKLILFAGFIASLLLCACQNANFNAKDGVDYAKMKTFRIEPFDKGTFAGFEEISPYENAFVCALKKGLEDRDFKPAEANTPADFNVKLAFSVTTADNPEFRTIMPDGRPDGLPFQREGALSMRVLLGGQCVYQSWAPYPAKIANFTGLDVANMVEWCLKDFPPKYKAVAVPKVKALSKPAENAPQK